MVFDKDQRTKFGNVEFVMTNDKFTASHDSFDDDDNSEDLAQERRREERRRRKNQKRRDEILPEGDPDILLESPKKSKQNKKKKRARTEPWLDDEELDVFEATDDGDDEDLWSDKWDS